MEPRFFDAHGHPNFPAYGAQQESVVGRALLAGVWMNAVGTTLLTSQSAVALAQKYPQGVYATVGIHPTHAEASRADPDELGTGVAEGVPAAAEHFDAAAFEALARHQKTVAVGECGLDYFRMHPETKGKQEELFRAHLELAGKAGKPLMLHVRPSKGSDDAYRDALDILSDYPGLTGDFHFFAGSPSVAREIIERGFYLSFTGVITFADSYDEVIRAAPLERLLVETDCPYVAPVPYRGKRNEPLYVREIPPAIARIRGENADTVAAALLSNTRRFFGV